MPRSIYGFAISGLGFDTAKEEGVAVYFGTGLAPQGSDYEWVPALVTQPEGVETSINPFTGDWETSAFQLEIEGSDRLAKLYFHEQARPSGDLAGPLTAGGTVPYPVSGLTGEVIWVGDEAILLGAYSGSAYTAASRGYWGTSSRVWPTGTQVFEDATPYIHQRIVRLVEHDLDTDAERIVWRGLVSNVALVGARVILSTEEALGALARAEVNTRPRNLRGQLVQRSSAYWELRSFQSAALRSTVAVTWLQVDEAIVPAYPTAGTLTWQVRAEAPFFPGAPRLDEQDLTDVEEVWEVLTLDTFSALPYPKHPLAIFLALTCSTGQGSTTPWAAYDILDDDFALDASDLIDTDSILTEIARTPGLEIDQLFLGLDGESFSPLSRGQELLLRPFGYFLGPKVDGRLKLSRLRILDVRDWEALTTNQLTFYADGPLEQDRAMGTGATRVVADVGGNPWTSPTEITVRPGASSTRRERYQHVAEHRLDYSALYPERIEVTDGRGQTLANALVNLMQMGLDAVPRVRCRVASDTISDDLDDLDLGSIAQIADTGVVRGWLLDETGTRRPASERVTTFAGMLVGRRLDLATSTYELSLLLVSYRIPRFARLRAPSAIVAAYNAGEKLLTLDTATFGEGSDPAEVFAVGDEIQFWSRSGTLKSSNVVSVQGATGDEIQLVAVPAAYTPVDGDVIRLAASKSYSNDGRFSVTLRPFVYLAPDSGGFEDADGTTGEVDVYGTEIFGGAG